MAPAGDNVLTPPGETCCAKAELSAAIMMPAMESTSLFIPPSQDLHPPSVYSMTYTGMKTGASEEAAMVLYAASIPRGKTLQCSHIFSVSEWQGNAIVTESIISRRSFLASASAAAAD